MHQRRIWHKYTAKATFCMCFLYYSILNFPASSILSRFHNHLSLFNWPRRQREGPVLELLLVIWKAHDEKAVLHSCYKGIYTCVTLVNRQTMIYRPLYHYRNQLHNPQRNVCNVLIESMDSRTIKVWFPDLWSLSFAIDRVLPPSSR